MSEIVDWHELASDSKLTYIDRGDFENRMVQHVKFVGQIKADKLCHYFRNLRTTDGYAVNKPQNVMWHLIAQGELILTSNWSIITTR